MYKFKVGDKVVRKEDVCCSYAWEEFLKEHSAPYYVVTSAHNQWIGLEGWVCGTATMPFNEDYFELYAGPAASDPWNYAEADRLEQVAKEAIKAYNEYVQRQPNKVYLPMYLPD